MAVLEQELFDKVIEYGKEAITKYNDGKYDDAFALAEQGWNQFPAPVDNWNQAYNYAKSFFGKTLERQDFDEAKKWLNRLIDNNNNLHLSDEEVRFLMGQYCYEKKDKKQAFEHWDILVKETGFRYFTNAKPEYSDFYKNYKDTEKDTEELSSEQYEAICDLLDKGDELSEEGKYKEAISTYEEALKGLPEPKEDWDIFDTIVVCIGDSYYEIEQYEKANTYYSMSLVSGNGVENPYVWYVKGRNHIKLGDIENGTDALIRAYMLDGTNIFKSDDNEFLQYIEKYIDEKE